MVNRGWKFVAYRASQWKQQYLLMVLEGHQSTIFP
jgi:hypothetical protein